MKKEDEFREKAIQFQLMQSNIQMLQEREGVLIKKMEELQKTKMAFEELDSTKKGDAFIPVGSGNFVSGNITDTDNVLVGIGSGVAIKKTMKDAVKIMDDRIDMIEKELKGISDEGQKLLPKLVKLQNEIEKLQK